MRWHRETNLIATIILSIFYLLIGFLNLNKGNPMMAVPQQSSYPPSVSLVYIIVSLAISWLFYYRFRKKPSEYSFVFTIVIGIILMFIGLFLWRIT